MKTYYVTVRRGKLTAHTSKPDHFSLRPRDAYYVAKARNKPDAIKLTDGYRIGYAWAVKEALDGNIRITHA